VAISDDQRLKAMVYGGALLGGGGGGSIAAGLAAGRRALCTGKPRLVSLSQLEDDCRLVTFSSVGTVRKVDSLDQLDGHHSRALELFFSADQHEIAGFISSEVGPLAVTYGWRESALTGIPVVDAPCNGRAHPLGLMGSLGLHRFPNYATVTTAVGGKRGTSQHLELSVLASVANAARIVRNTVANASVPLAVVRNSVPASYVRRHGAPGGLKYAQRVGSTLLSHVSRGYPRVLQALSRLMGGKILAEGFVKSAKLDEKEGFTVGTIAIRSEVGKQISIPVCNEFMMVLDGESALAAFPDLITVFDAASSLPLGSAEVSQGQQVAVFAVPRSRLKLGSTMKDRAMLRPIEKLLGVHFPA
jgi:uncharacterized protein